MNPKEEDEFRRMEIMNKISRSREIIKQYELGFDFCRTQIEDSIYELGRINERLGD